MALVLTPHIIPIERGSNIVAPTFLFVGKLNVRVISVRSPQARAVAFADDGFVYDSLSSALHIWVQLSHDFKNDTDLAMQLDKCKLYVQGDLTREEARAKVLQIIDGDDALSSAP